MHVRTQLVLALFLVSFLFYFILLGNKLWLCAEIFEFETNDDDKFMILASDGVWEFLSNAQVIDMIVPYWHRNDLKGACKTVVE